MKEKIKIEDIIITINKFIIKTNKTIYISYINNGSVNFVLLNENNNEINIGNLEVNDIIKIYYNKNNEENIINKIIIKNKYLLNSDSENFDDII